MSDYAVKEQELREALKDMCVDGYDTIDVSPLLHDSVDGFIFVSHLGETEISYKSKTGEIKSISGERRIIN